MLLHRNYEIRWDPKPIPSRDFDYDFSHVDYDGPEDRRCGAAGSIRDCIIIIDEMIEDEEDKKDNGGNNAGSNCANCEKQWDGHTGTYCEHCGELKPR